MNTLSYEIVEQTSDQCCHFQFNGTFLNENVRWNAELVTLAYYAARNGQRRLQQFIEVGDADSNGRRITIALNLPSIDEPAILKTIIMVRQYRLLSAGKHTYGEYFTFE